MRVHEEAGSYILENDQVRARIDAHSADLLSLIYKGVEMVGGNSGHPHGYWSHAPGPRSTVVDVVTIDPQSNGGERAEVAIRASAGGKPLGNGPGGSAITDVEIRYGIARGDSAVWTYCIFHHPASYGATQLGEARFAAKLTPGVFDYLSVDARRQRLMPLPADWDAGTQLNMKEARRLNTGLYKGEVEHKYDYTADQFDNPAFGWSSTTRQLGFWIINPSSEYLSGGPTKYELMAHLDGSESGGAAPTMLNYWRSSHYGGSVCAIDAGEEWTKVVGPFWLYCNSAPAPAAMWHDALDRAATEAKAWPYDWVQGADYPKRAQRSVVTGRLVLEDPIVKGPWQHLLVGLAAPEYSAPAGRTGTVRVEWQNDAKHYEFWTHGDAAGNFQITGVRPGRYTLYAIADGVLGQFAQADVVVGEGQQLALPALTWRPVRYGRQLWDIGIPNRNGSEFLKGDDYWHWGMYLKYSQLFPHDIVYTIGQSDFRKDWFIYQVPHVDHDDGTGHASGRATPWTVNFKLPEAPQGRAILRLAIDAVGARSLEVRVNDHTAGTVTGLVYNATINRDGIEGSWVEKDVPFDASLMHAGSNTLTLTVPAGGVMNGIGYDYLRLELAPK